MLDKYNLYSDIPYPLKREEFRNILNTGAFKLERIVSKGQATPPGEWFDQEVSEWVVLLKGCAGLSIEDQEELLILHPGDYVHLPAHCRHRVEWTDCNGETVWLALHYSS